MASGEVDMGDAFAKRSAMRPEEEENPEIAATIAACDALPAEIAEKIKSMFGCNGLTMADLDVKSVTELGRLHITLQQKVLAHMESERVFLCNSRSKSRFLISTCERAKQGALDVRGFGAIDPWKLHLSTIAVKTVKPFEFVKEAEYLEQVGESSVVQFEIDISADSMLVEANSDKPNSSILEMSIPLRSPLQQVWDRVNSMGCSFPSHMKFREAEFGFLRPKFTCAYYNLPVDQPVRLTLARKSRGGIRRRRDWSEQNPHPSTRQLLLNTKPAMPAMGGMANAAPGGVPGAGAGGAAAPVAAPMMPGMMPGGQAPGMMPGMMNMNPVMLMMQQNMMKNMMAMQQQMQQKGGPGP